MKDLKRAAWASACVSVLYLIVSVLLSVTEFSLRTWVDVTGKVTAGLILPLFLLMVLLSWADKRNWNGKRFLVGVAVAGYALCAFCMVFFLIFTVERERKLMEDLIVAEKGGFFGEPSYAYYRPVAVFFKVSTEITDETKMNYLEKKYHREFMADRAESGKICDKEFPEVKVDVYVSNMEFEDDYVEGMVLKYLLEGYKRLGMERSYYVSDSDTGRNGYMCVEFDGAEDIPEAAEDIEQLISYVMGRTNFFDDKLCSIRFSYKEGEGECTGSVPFGYTEEYLDGPMIPRVNQIEGYIWIEYGGSGNDYGQVPERTDNTLQYGEESGAEADGSMPGTEFETGEEAPDIEPDNREVAAKTLYDEVFAEEGYSYEVCYNAKGNLYIDLGSKTSEEQDGRMYDYRLVYDRPSKNGACELFVLYRSAGGMGDEVIVDMYAVETDTGKVVASGKRTWSDVGREEYREMTGE